MSRAENKADRLMKMEALLLAHPEGLTQAEMARHLGVDRSVIHRNLYDFQKLYPTIEHNDGRISLDRAAYLVKVAFTLHEATAVHIAARLMATRMDRQNPHAASALRKLGVALEKLAPRISSHVKQAADVVDDASQWQDPRYLDVLEQLTLAWAEQRKVKVKHRSDKAQKVFEYFLCPYFIEPYAVGQTTHLIARDESTAKMRTLKIERIEKVELTQERYEIPADFDPRDLLADAWGIWYTEHEPVEVTLKFNRSVAGRLKETRWHRSEEETELEDGAILWKAKVAEPQEMIPWIRAWGADCEVVGPKELREELIGETKQLIRVYGVARASDKNAGRILRLWGKTKKGSQNPQDFHPAVFHMLDVANIAHELLGERASPRWRNALAEAFGVAPESLVDWLPYVIALHDIGKISSAFQSLNKEQLARLRREGFTLNSAEMRHEHITQVYLESALPQMFGNPSSKLPQVASESLGGHHGSFAHPDDDLKTARRQLNSEPGEWKIFRQAADAILQNELLKRDLTSLTNPSNISIAIMALTGFAILCDWLGSDERYFPLAPNVELEEYIERSRDRAARAAHESGLLTLPQSGASTQVQSLFSDLIPLRPLQLAIDDIPDEILQSPSLTIIEAPTGEGKTEAALALAHRIARITGTDELYYALPTMATSNQIFERLQTHLEKRLGLAVSVKLVHGQAYLLEKDLTTETLAAAIEPLENGETKNDSEAIESVAWFNSKKRALLAPFGVGTIDQAELAALNVKHAALRMMGLVGKVVIVDEVHAYDTYMTTVIERLLRWLATMNTSVILLSATLPKSRRKKLAEAYNAELNLTDEKQDAYPSLLVLTNGKKPHFAKPKVWQPNRVLELRELHFGDDTAAEKAKWLLDSITNGGCACWITNTVKRAQRIFDVLRKNAPVDVDLQLLHSQFPLDERQRREDDLKSKYSREGKRPAKGIVVGTQVLEQSLDLDFDVMVSDLAPIDLLLQRAGRLHRHDRTRPEAHATPRLWLNFERMPSGDLKLGTDRTIYDEFIMRQTRATLAERTQIQLPNDYRALIEAVYSDKKPSEDSSLYDAWYELDAKKKSAAREARGRLLPEPSRNDSFAQTAAMHPQFKEDENGVNWITAKTRLGEETLNIIPLERNGDFIILDANKKINVRAEASRELQLCLLRRHLRISNKNAIGAILEDVKKGVTELFAQSALLKEFYPLWLTNGETKLETEHGRLKIKLDPQLGLVIEKESKVNDTDE
ncbi:MAG: CRISPR-associated helicase Cas3' [Chloroflexota bacterium]